MLRLRKRAAARAPEERPEGRAWIDALIDEAERIVGEAALLALASGEVDVEPALSEAIDALERARARAS